MQIINLRQSVAFNTVLSAYSVLDIDNIIEFFIEYKNKISKSKDFTIRVEGNTIAIFSNDLQKLLELKSIKDLPVDAFSRERMDFTLKELLEERDGVKHLL